MKLLAAGTDRLSVELLFHEWKRRQISVGRSVPVQPPDGGCKRRERNPDDFQDLSGKRIAVQATTKAEDLCSFIRLKSDVPQMEQVNCFSTTNEIYAALRKNYADAIAGHEAMLGSLVQDGEGCLPYAGGKYLYIRAWSGF